jgi:hypothetical protein
MAWMGATHCYRECETNTSAKGLKLDAALTVALFGNFALIVSVILVGLQVREMTKQSSHGVRATLASVYQAMNDDMLQIIRLFIDRPSLRPYFYGEQELNDVSSEERERVEPTAELFINFIDNVLTQMRYSQVTSHSRGAPISLASPQAVLCFVTFGSDTESGTRKKCARSWIL